MNIRIFLGRRNHTYLSVATFLLWYCAAKKITRVNKEKDLQARIDLKNEIVLQSLARAGVLKG
jgi:hypothetical protein